MLDRLTSLSEARYGAVRGLPRLLDLLDAEDVAGTFYVPGDTAQRHADAIRKVMDKGHEIGHHGHRHLHEAQMDEAGCRAELEQGLESLQKILDVVPRGYRSPGWELSTNTFALLLEFGFAYDSSCMGDDRPYFEEVGSSQILELPVHWSLDDVCFYRWSRNVVMHPTDVLYQTWLAEFESALAERRHVSFTMHPEVIGRGYRIRELTRLIRAMRERANVWFATHEDVAQWVASTLRSEQWQVPAAFNG
jgi:peptidoglycan/xylan/chitin deacetylase (PgdA/CDA1 family)